MRRAGGFGIGFWLIAALRAAALADGRIRRLRAAFRKAEPVDVGLRLRWPAGRRAPEPGFFCLSAMWLPPLQCENLS